MNKCKFCGLERPEEEFYDNYRYKIGLRSWCTLCNRGLLERHDRPGLSGSNAARRKNPV